MSFLPRLWWGRLGNTYADEAATARALTLRTRQSPDRLSSLIGPPTGHSSCHSRWGGAGGIPEDGYPPKDFPSGK